MKISELQLKQLVAREVKNILNEGVDNLQYIGKTEPRFDTQYIGWTQNKTQTNGQTKTSQISTVIQNLGIGDLDKMIKSTGIVGNNLSGWYVKLSQALKRGEKVTYIRPDGKKYYLSQPTLDCIRKRYNDLYTKAPQKSIEPSNNITKQANA